MRQCLWDLGAIKKEDGRVNESAISLVRDKTTCYNSDKTSGPSGHIALIRPHWSTTTWWSCSPHPQQDNTFSSTCMVVYVRFSCTVPFDNKPPTHPRWLNHLMSPTHHHPWPQRQERSTACHLPRQPTWTHAQSLGLVLPPVLRNANVLIKLPEYLYRTCK
jgi:hypothetical protein